MKRSSLVIIIAGAAFAIAGCADLSTSYRTEPEQVELAQPNTVAVPQTPQQAVFATKYALLAALSVVADYRKLPACAPQMIICRSPSVETRLQALSNGAAAALDEAEKVVRTPGFAKDQVTTLVVSAQAAVRALTVITDTLKTR